jgi:hypothetical protein
MTEIDLEEEVRNPFPLKLIKSNIGFFILAALATISSTSLAESPPSPEELEYVEEYPPLIDRIDHRIRISHANSLEPGKMQEFLDALAKIDKGQYFDLNYKPPNFETVDSFIFLVDRWETLQSVSEDFMFSEAISKAAKLGPDSLKYVSIIDWRNERPIDLVFYSIEGLEHVPMQCFAESYWQTLVLGILKDTANPAECR